MSIFLFFLILIYFIDYAITVVPFFSPLYSPLPCTSPPTIIPHLSSCPWVIHVNSLASSFPILFLTSPYFVPTIYASYSLYLFPHSSLSLSPLITLHVISISMTLFLFCCLLSLIFTFNWIDMYLYLPFYCS